MNYKVMKRPMFKMGGTASSQGTGITSGLDEKVNMSGGRANYANGPNLNERDLRSQFLTSALEKYRQREERQQDLANLVDLQALAKVLKEGKNLIIFPEGRRTRDGELGDFKKTFAILAKELNVPVTPVGIKGAYEAFPTGTKFPKSGKVDVKFFEKIEPKGKTYEEIAEQTRKTIKSWL